MGGLQIGKITGGQSNIKTDAYTISEYDFRNIVVFDTMADVTCIIPNGLRVGFECTVVQRGSGKVKFATEGDSADDAKVNGARLTQKTPAAWSWANILCTAVNEYTVNFTGGNSGTGPYAGTDTILYNPHLVGNILYFDLLNVTTGAVIPNYQSVLLQSSNITGIIKYINVNEYTLLAEDAGAVLVFGTIGRAPVNEAGYTVYVPDGLPDNFNCTLVPKDIPPNEFLQILTATGAQLVQLININQAFATEINCQQILLQSIGFIGDFGLIGYNISFIEQTLNQGQGGGGANADPIVITEAFIGGVIATTGTASAVNGLVDGSTTISSVAFTNKRVRVLRNYQELPSRDLGDGNTFFTKVLGSANIELSNALSDTEFLKIETIN